MAAMWSTQCLAGSRGGAPASGAADGLIWSFTVSTRSSSSADLRHAPSAGGLLTSDVRSHGLCCVPLRINGDQDGGQVWERLYFICGKYMNTK